MSIAEAVSKQSPDPNTKVGSILVNNATNAIIATGFNGYVRGAPDDIMPKTAPEKYKHFIHSELNLLLHCCRHGISTDNTTLICNMSPCSNCARTLYQAGITNVICNCLYKDFKDNLSMIDLNITYEILNIENKDYYIITLGSKV